MVAGPTGQEPGAFGELKGKEMKVTELKDKIVIAGLDPEKDYILLVNPALVNFNSLRSYAVAPRV